MREKSKSKLKSEIIEWIRFIILLFIVYVIVTNTISITRVSGHSMDPTLQDGSWIAVNRLSTHFGKPKFGDVVIVSQEDKNYDIIKRIIGLPGDTVFIKGGTVFINDIPIPEVYTLGSSPDMEEITIEEDHIFILGDNRELGESLDSRDPSIGTIPINNIKGYAMISLFPTYTIMKPLKF